MTHDTLEHPVTPAGGFAMDEAYRRMRVIRAVEESIVDLVNQAEIPGATHEYTGQEAVAVGVCAALAESDVLTSTHRGHGHVLARGASPSGVLAELMARESGLNHGRGGSMHVADLALGILGANGMVGAGGPIAVGAVWARRRRAHEAVGVCFFGDGAVNQGVLLEAMNLAAIMRVPVLFACENNGFAVTLRAEDAIAGTILDRARAFGIPVATADGMDVAASYRAAHEAIERMRLDGMPAFIEFETYRFSGHSTGERYLGVNYRTDGEMSAWRTRDPLTIAAARMDPGTVTRIDADVSDQIAQAIEYARGCAFPDPATAMDFMYAKKEV